MRMKKSVVVTVLASFCLASCGVKPEGSDTGVKGMTEKVEEVVQTENQRSEIENFQKLMSEEVEGDRKSVYWDGSHAVMREDPLDIADIQDGRYVIEGVQKVTIPDTFEFSYPNALENVVVESKKEEDYHITAKDYDIQIKRIDYEEEKEKIASDPAYVRIEEEVLSPNQTKYFKSYELYEGIVNTSGGTYAGYTLLFESELDHRAYLIGCSGIGYLYDIRQVGFYIMNHFDVLFY